MNKTVILSTNDNPDYLLYLPYVQKAWNQLGWKTLTYYLGEKNAVELSDSNNRIIKLVPSDKYRPETICQVSRLFGHQECEGIVMTGDVDMIPLADYWNPSEEGATVWGYDLTGRSEFPICYIAMMPDLWKEIIPEGTIDELLDKYPNALSQNFYSYWGVDQQIMTSRMKRRIPSHLITLIDRGFTNGLAQGRIDRAAWESTINNSDRKIDAHMIRPFDKEQAERVMKLIQA